MPHMSLPGDHEPVTALRNLGPASAEWLRNVDIVTVGDLRKLGAVLAWKIVRQRHPEANLLLLHALHAALEDRHWQDLSKEEKDALKAEADEPLGMR
ncbi:MAG: TfoX/Sxy family DNA transformation protein [Rhodothermales bacterium]